MHNTDSTTMDREGLKEFQTSRKVDATIETNFRSLVGDGDGVDGPPSQSLLLDH